MAMHQLTLRAKLSLLAALLALFGVFALAWQLRRQYNQRAVAACGELRPRQRPAALGVSPAAPCGATRAARGALCKFKYRRGAGAALAQCWRNTSTALAQR